MQEVRESFIAALPRQASRGDREKGFSFTDVSYDELDTLEALASGYHVIARPALNDAHDGIDILVDALVKTSRGTYMPVAVSGHRVSQPNPAQTRQCIAVSRLGLGAPVTRHIALRHHTLDGYVLGLAARALQELGCDSGWGGVVGQESSTKQEQWVVLAETGYYQEAIDAALKAPVAERPRRLRQCGGCRYWEKCRAELAAADDISLLLSGNRAATYRRHGITTITGLAEAQEGTASQLARAYQRGVEFLRRESGFRQKIPRADSELDIDMEAYRDEAAYLWGIFDGSTYHPFVTWDLSAEAVAANFAAFWRYLKEQRAQAQKNRRSFCAYCYSNHGENHWLLRSAELYAGYPGVPRAEEIKEFIGSAQWVDVFDLVRARLLGVHGIGLKAVGKAAGYSWSKEELAGAASIYAFKNAQHDPALQAEILSYNRDDCCATAQVRQWLDDAAPGVTMSA